jgi:hypothetical protein
MGAGILFTAHPTYQLKELYRGDGDRYFIYRTPNIPVKRVGSGMLFCFII